MPNIRSSLLLLLLSTVSQAADFSLQRGSFRAETLGRGLMIKTGSNARAGVATLSGGSVLINNTTITANTVIFAFPQSQATGLLNSNGVLFVSSKTNGSSFRITSTSGGDNSTIAWFLIELIP